MPVNIPGDSRVVTRGRVVIGPSSYGMSAVGGDTVQDVSISGVTYRVHTFTNSGILTVTTGPTGTATIEYLLVGGGGGGGSFPNGHAGGGGAGGYITGNLTLLSSGQYNVIIGPGGSGGSNSSLGTNGGDTTLQTSPTQILLLAYGGGYGASAGTAGGTGGSGGGGTAYLPYPYYATPGGSSLFSQGNSGGAGFRQDYNPAGAGGGGGGAGGVGVSGQVPNASNGGNAIQSFITGFPQWFAAGGGGTLNFNSGLSGNGGIGGNQILGGRSVTFNGINPINGMTNTGSGGGATYTGTSGNGGSGIAIIRYRLS